MPELDYKSNYKKSHTEVKQLTPKQRRVKARYIPCCHHCGTTQDLLTFKRADGRDLTICRSFAIMAGYVARGGK